MTPDLDRLAALAAALAPSAAGRLLALVSGSDATAAAARAGALAALPRAGRLAALAAAAGPPGGSAWTHPILGRLGLAAAPEPPVRAAAGGPARGRAAAHAPREGTVPRAASPGTGRETRPGVPLPFALPALTPGFAALTPSARAEGRDLAGAAARALGALLGSEVRIEGRPLPAPAGAAGGVARVAVALEGLASTALVEVDAGLLARALERLPGGPPRTRAALAPSPIEQGLLELLVLVAVDASRSPRVHAIAPRVAPGAPPRDASAAAGAGALLVGLDLAVGEEAGRGRFILPLRAVHALETPPADLPDAIGALAAPASLRRGATSLTREELLALAPGDVVLLDDGPPAGELVLPGGLALRGRLADGHLHVEEIRMTETQATYPITLAVEIARVTVTLGELARLEPGAALPLRVPPEGAVVLRAGERALARGELVDVGGGLGVRIAELGESP